MTYMTSIREKSQNRESDDKIANPSSDVEGSRKYFNNQSSSAFKKENEQPSEREKLQQQVTIKILKEIPEMQQFEENLSDKLSDNELQKTPQESIQEPEPEKPTKILLELDKFLKTRCGYEGRNIEIEARRFIIFCRAIISKPKLLLVYEESLIFGYGVAENLNTLGSKLPDTTILVILANTDAILLYDQIVFMDNGMILEKGDPHDLLRKKESFLSRFLKETDGARLSLLKEEVEEQYSKTSGCITGKDSAMSPPFIRSPIHSPRKQLIPGRRGEHPSLSILDKYLTKHKNHQSDLNKPIIDTPKRVRTEYRKETFGPDCPPASKVQTEKLKSPIVHLDSISERHQVPPVFTCRPSKLRKPKEGRILSSRRGNTMQFIQMTSNSQKTISNKATSHQHTTELPVIPSFDQSDSHSLKLADFKPLKNPFRGKQPDS